MNKQTNKQTIGKTTLTLCYIVVRCETVPEYVLFLQQPLIKTTYFASGDIQKWERTLRGQSNKGPLKQSERRVHASVFESR